MNTKNTATVAKDTTKPTINAIVGGIISCVIACKMIEAIDELMSPPIYSQGIKGQYLWITSSSKKTTRMLPFHQALRIVRKHHWRLAVVTPVRHISRLEALKILLKGNGWTSGGKG